MNPSPFPPKPAPRVTLPTPGEETQAGHKHGNPGHDTPSHDTHGHHAHSHTHQAQRTLSPADSVPASPALLGTPPITSALGWPAWLRVLAVLPVIVLLWLAVGWASSEVAPW